MVRFFLAAEAAFLMFLRAAAFCFVLAMLDLLELTFLRCDSTPAVGLVMATAISATAISKDTYRIGLIAIRQLR
jgi:hypothetical protein